MLSRHIFQIGAYSCFYPPISPIESLLHLPFLAVLSEPTKNYCLCLIREGQIPYYHNAKLAKNKVSKFHIESSTRCLSLITTNMNINLGNRISHASSCQHL